MAFLSIHVVHGQIPAGDLDLWLRSDAGVQTSGSSVTQWDDQSGNARHATPSYGVPPLLVPNQVNGLPVLRFNGTNNGLATPAFTAFPNKRGCMFVVVKINGPSFTSGGGFSHICGTWYSPSGTTMEFGATTANYGYFDGVGTVGFNVAPLPPSAWGIVTLHRNADTSFDFYKSGIIATTSTVANNQPSSLPQHIGYSGYPGISEVLNGDLAEIIFYGRSLSPAEIEQVNTYLANKYTFNGDIPLPTASGTTICGPGSATLTASGGTAYRWYDSPSATVPVATTASFTTPLLNATTTYYVANYPGTLVSQRVPVTVTVNLPGTACDDGNPGTINDALNGQCQCVGTPPYQDQNLALALDGNFQHASTLAQPSLTIGPALTLEAWIKPDAFVYGEIFSVCNDPNSPCSGQDYKALAFRVDASGVVTALIAPTTYASRLLGKQTTTSLVLGQWVHVAATLDLGTNEAHIYFNGIEQPGINLATGSGSGSFTDHPAIGALQVTGLANTIQYPFSGSIDELRVWNSALPQTSIAQYACAYSLTGHPQSANLVALYHIEDGQAPDNTVVDAAGGRNATLTNASVATAYVPSGAAQGGTCGCALGPIGAPCNDGNPNTLNDAITSTCQCVGTISGASAEALQLDGVGDHVVVPDNNALDPGAGDFTISFWVRKDAATNNWQNSFAMGKWTSGSVPGSNEWAVSLANGPFNNIPSFSLESGTNMVLVTGTTPMPVGTWTHIAAVRDGNTALLYMNGVLQASQTLPNGFTVNNVGRDLVIGLVAGFAYTNAAFDEIQYCDQALCINQLLQRMNCPLTGTEPELVAYYNCDQGVAGGNNTGLTTLIDLAGTPQNGTLVNMSLNGTTSNWIAPGPVGTTPCGPLVLNTYYQDLDGDGLGDPAVSVQDCSAPVGYVADNSDNCPSTPNVDQTDTDGDLIGDACDVCPLGPNPGSPCNDNNPFTSGDAVQAGCGCAGTPSATTTWTLEFATDNAGSESTWQIVDASSPFVLASGGPYASNTTTTIPVTVPTGACFNLIVTDANGMSSGTTGGWVLRDNNGRRVIDNAGDGVFAGTVQAPLPFCSPVGNDVLLLSKCDKVDWLPTGVVIA
ncbi:MAG: LamG domain-containing protein, partial [Flavobacteriales bacterium]|nr:LamG domain-containing protein [Flavobacteriales bacterium]